VQLKKKQKLKAFVQGEPPDKELRKQRKKDSQMILMRKKHTSCRKSRMEKC